MPARRFSVLAAALVLAAASCSGGSLFDGTSTAPTTSGPTTAPPPPTTATSAPPTSSSPDPTTSTSTPRATIVPTCCPGAPGIGDELFPTLGNGGYDVVHYDLDLNVDPEDNELEATATISAVATEDLVSFNLDLHGLEVRKVTVDGVETAFAREGDELVVGPVAIGAGRAYEVAVEYAGTPDPSPSAGIPFPMGWNGHDDTTFVIAEPNGAQTWFPANDHPRDKATFGFTITVPDGYTAVANGALVETAAAADRTVFRWESAHPMATYLATAVVAPLERREDTAAAGVPIRNYFPPAIADQLEEAFAVTPEVLDFLAEIFGPYPFEAYGVVVVGDFPGALETQTMSVFGLGTARASFLETIIVHEAAHQWFGDSVSPQQWRDVWLNEGFATYAEWLWAEHTGGVRAYDGVVSASHAVMDPRVHRPPGDPVADDLFSSAVYDRGALTLHALRETIGDDAFFATLRAFADRFAYGTATTADFTMLAEEISGRNLDELFADWLLADDLPPLP